ncbi:MAG: hypothetical protein ABSH10_03160 [Phycisphaerae bacterium]|jgi:hypothetical protein
MTPQPSQSPQADSAGAPPSDAPADPGRLVPVSESIKYRRRAQQAENRLQEIEQHVVELKAQMDHRSEELALAEAQRDEARSQLVAAANQRSAERYLMEAGVVDLEAANLLLSKRLDLAGDPDDEAIRRNVEQLLLDKPFLLRPAASLPPSTASPRSERLGPFAQLAQAAERAVRTGSRRDVAEYLRLRRQGAAATRRPGAK